MLRRIPIAFALAFIACKPPNLNLTAPDAGNINALPLGVCSPDGWCWRNPLPQGEPANAVWGTSSDNVWVAANAGTLVQWDGKQWNSDSPNTTTYDLMGVWSPGNGEVWAVTRSGTIQHWDPMNKMWGAISPFGIDDTTAPDLFGIWGSGPSDIWVVGDLVPGALHGTLLHYDGTNWNPDNSAPAVPLYAVWGANQDDVWVMGGRFGTGPVALHNTGSSTGGADWMQVTSGVPSGENLRGVFGTSSMDVWAVGDDGMVIHWDGTTWTQLMISGAFGEFTSVWSGAMNDVWIAGAGAALYHALDGMTFYPVSLPSQENFTGVWGGNVQDAWVVGDQSSVLHYTTAGSEGSSFSATTATLTGAYVTPDGSAVRFVGNPSGILRNEGGQWTLEPVSSPNLVAIAGNSASDIWAVGNSGEIEHWGGSSWETSLSGTTKNLWAVTGDGTGDMWAVGDNGTTIKYLATAATPGWVSFPSGATQKLLTVFALGENDVWAAGIGGTLINWNGTAWIPSELPDTSDIYALWGTTGAKGGIYAAGTGGIYVASSTGVWQNTMANGSGFLALTGTGPNDIWAVGSSGLALHWDGGPMWNVSNTGVTNDILAAAASTTGGTWVAGRGGVVLQSMQ